MSSAGAVSRCDGTMEEYDGYAFRRAVAAVDPSCSRFAGLGTLQINLGNRCNLACSHCHVDGSPSGTRVMTRGVIDDVIRFISRCPGIVLDITGGAPELHPDFRYLVEATARPGLRRIVRTNLAVTAEPGMEWLPRFYRDHGLVLCASLPCYLEENVDRQRGEGVCRRSIEALRTLNSHGYGESLELNLVYNPAGTALPGGQIRLQEDYRKQLLDRYGIRFTALFTITNMPVGRFRAALESEDGALFRYLSILSGGFNPAAAPGIMCRSLINVDWRGRLYNCDFNQAAGLPIRGTGGFPLTVRDLEDAAKPGADLVFGSHCFGCTAGSGSGCTGAVIAGPSASANGAAP